MNGVGAYNLNGPAQMCVPDEGRSKLDKIIAMLQQSNPRIVFSRNVTPVMLSHLESMENRMYVLTLLELEHNGIRGDVNQMRIYTITIEFNIQCAMSRAENEAKIMRFLDRLSYYYYVGPNEFRFNEIPVEYISEIAMSVCDLSTIKNIMSYCVGNNLKDMLIIEKNDYSERNLKAVAMRFLVEENAKLVDLLKPFGGMDNFKQLLMSLQNVHFNNSMPYPVEFLKRIDATRQTMDELNKSIRSLQQFIGLNC